MADLVNYVVRSLLRSLNTMVRLLGLVRLKLSRRSTLRAMSSVTLALIGRLVVLVRVVVTLG